MAEPTPKASTPVKGEAEKELETSEKYFDLSHEDPGDATIPHGDATMKTPEGDGVQGTSDANNNDEGKNSKYTINKKKARLLKRYGTTNMSEIRKIKNKSSDTNNTRNLPSFTGGQLLPGRLVLGLLRR